MLPLALLASGRGSAVAGEVIAAEAVEAPSTHLEGLLPGRNVGNGRAAGRRVSLLTIATPGSGVRLSRVGSKWCDTTFLGLVELDEDSSLLSLGQSVPPRRWPAMRPCLTRSQIPSDLR